MTASDYDYGIFETQNLPTSVNGVHQSVYRAYHILSIVQKLLAGETPSDVVLTILHELRSLPPKEERLPWIPVSERLPEKEFCYYLVWIEALDRSDDELDMGMPEGWTSNAEFNLLEWKGERVPVWTIDDEYINWGRVTHWMPLPEGPG